MTSIGANGKKQTEEEVKNIWKKVDAVCFDVDSTVITEEGIDCLAEFCGRGNEVAEWTKKAMGGSIQYQIALEERLNIIQPSHQQIEAFLKSRPAKFTPGVEALVHYLHSKNVDIYLVSGGFTSLISPIAEKLQISTEKIYANKLKFYFTGEYAGYDDKQPTARSGGKAIVAESLKKQGYKNVVFIGDGVTDLEASSYADAFIGFGGNVIRQTVRDRSSWFITDFKILESVHRDS